MDFSKLTAYLDSLEEKYGVPGYDLIITKGHETVYRHMGGHSDYDSRVPMNGNELYYIYSATKVITMVAAMQLIQAGKLVLDDPVSKYLPEFEHMQVADHFELGKWPPEIPTLKDPHHPARTPITLRMLMTMTAGFNYDTSGEPIVQLKKETGNQADTRQMMGAIAQMPLLFEPGTHYSYSLSHDVTAAVIEVVSGLSFGEYLKKNIFEPLGVSEMYFHLTDALRPRLMAQYGCWPDPDTPAPVPQENSYCLSDRYESGGAGLCCTVEAYSAVMEALANGGTGRTGKQILTPEGIALLSTNQLNDTMLAEYRAPWRMDYGYGLGVRTKIAQGTSPAPIGEFGWDGAAGAYGLADPVNHIGFFYAQEVLVMMKVYEEIHPRLRDLAYEALLSE
jgi:CubicO group peptidase (beta-lactamase class C family)